MRVSIDNVPGDSSPGYCRSPLTTSPRIVHGVGHDGFAIGLDGYWELDGLRICLARLRGLFGQFPVIAAVEMLDRSHVNRFFLVVADADLETLIHPMLA